MARDALVKDRTAALNRQKQVRHRLLKQQHKNRLAQLDRHLAAIDTEIGKRLAEDEGLARRAEILTSIPGVSHVTAAGLLTRCRSSAASTPRRLPAWQASRRHAAVRCLAGSQLHPGRPGAGASASVYAGPAAIRYNPDLRAKYRQLVAEGKPRKVAVVAVMRKLLLLANALLEQDRCWLPERPGRDSASFVAA